MTATPAMPPRIGLSSYAFFWRGSDLVSTPLDLDGMLRECARLGVHRFQICDRPEIEDYDPARLAALRTLAEELDIALELGTRGTDPTHLRTYLRLATALNVTLIRSMWSAGEDHPDAAESERRLREILPELEATGITLALETYERVTTAELITLVRALDSPRIGICLDPANTVANFEEPMDVVIRCAPYTVNWHVKDFAFSRSPGWVGFAYGGTALGHGRFNYDRAREILRPAERGISEIVEFWLPWQEDEAHTIRVEAEWTRITLDYLLRKNGREK